MTWNLQQTAVVGVMLAASATLGACGGGDISPNPVVEVVTVKKELQGQSSNDVPSTVALLVTAGVGVIAKKCATLKPEPSSIPGTSNLGLLRYAVLVDIAATDVQKAKSVGYLLFSAADAIPDSIVAC